MRTSGSVAKVAGPVVGAENMKGAIMQELVEVGKERLIGEIIRLDGESATIQVYQNTSGLKVGDKVLGTGSPLSVELAPGLVGNVFDGIQRPLETLKKEIGPFILRGRTFSALPREKKWNFSPVAQAGMTVSGGDQ